MEQVQYGPRFSGGSLTIPPSKSAAIRAALCYALAGGGTLSNMDASQDVAAAWTAAQILLKNSGRELDCGESGALLRFSIPICAALGGRWRFTGRGRLPQRPIGIYAELLPAHGVAFHTQGGLPLEIEGQLIPGRFELPGNITSQFVTGLMMALPLLPGDSDIILTTPLESSGYVDLTLDILKDFGIIMTSTAEGWHIPGNQKYRPRDYVVEGDWSHAAFFLNLAALSPAGAPVRINGLRPDSLQGDRACVEVFGGFGLDIHWEDGVLLAQNTHFHEPFGGLCGQTIDVSQITDMVPAASICAALSKGETRFLNCARLRLKESDRLTSMVEAINALGGQAEAAGDEMRIYGVESLQGGTANGQNDHRVVMALAGAALRSRNPVRVTDPWSIRKTYPKFFQVFQELGGEADVIQLG